MTEQSERNESRIITLELQMKNLIDEQKELDKEIKEISIKIDKIMWFLMALLAVTNPVTSELVHSQIKSSTLGDAQPAQADERAK